MRWDGPDGYWASDDAELLNLDLIHQWISEQSYWAKGRPRDVMEAAVRSSLNVGLYRPDGAQAGYARIVSDYATFGWLCDVFLAEGERGHGLGSFLIRTTVEHPAVRHTRQFLATSPGRTIYHRFGYQPLRPDRQWLERTADPAQ
jgi:GNAT superfamily N-acetyltransferase